MSSPFESNANIFSDAARRKFIGQIEADKNQKKTVDDWLNNVNYHELNTGNYKPTQFALKFMNFIKLVNGGKGEDSLTPVVHLVMLDKLVSPLDKVANLCARGLAKTTLMFEYLVLYLAVFGEIDGFGDVSGMIYVSDSMDNGVKSARKNIEFRFMNSDFMQEWVPEYKFTDNMLEFTNKAGHKLGVRMFGAKTGLRGTKIYSKRPVLAVLDDLVSDDDAKSKSAMDAIKDTVYKGVDYALDPTRRKIVFNGTPFNKNDILYEAVESGAWDVNVWPVCEKFPCTESEFRGAWPDRFTYKYVKRQYEDAIMSGKLAAFNQELMLRITSEDERLVQDSEIKWYPRQPLLNHRNAFNFYITTDFAVKAEQSNDLSVISVWAYNAQGDWFWVDGICKRQTMDENIDDLFRLAQEYRPQQVGIEVSGQQYAFISWLQREMITRNIWFNFASDGKSKKPGINPTVNKLQRFNQILPQIKAGKLFFPEEMRDSVIMGEFVEELSLAMITGFKSRHDDCIDTISMLIYLNPWKPSDASGNVPSNDPQEIDHDSIFDTRFPEEKRGINSMSSYTV